MVLAILVHGTWHNSFGQNDWKDSLRIASEMATEDYEYLKSIIQEDVTNWPDQIENKIREPVFFLKTMLLLLKDTAVYVAIATKNGTVWMWWKNSYDAQLEALQAATPTSKLGH